MLSGVQPCFQLLRIGSSAGGVARDLYTFRPALASCVFRLGRAPELCDVTLEAASVSRIHAELHAERGVGPEDEGEDGGWTVHIKDRSSHGTWVNEARLQPGDQWELSDGDTLSFGGESDSPSSEFYFLFQKVKVRPMDFDAITIPKTGSFSSDLQNRIRTSRDQQADGLSKASLNRATVILSSIGSLSKMKGRVSVAPPTARTGPSSSSRSRRKSAHTVLLEDDSSDEPRRDPSASVPPPQLKGQRGEARRPFEARPFPAGTRTIGSYHGAVTNSQLHPQYPSPAHRHGQVSFTVHRDPDTHLVRLASRDISEGASPRPQHAGVLPPGGGRGELQPGVPLAEAAGRGAGEGPVEQLPHCHWHDLVQWIQCDVCDAWFHTDCLHAAHRKKILADPNADFQCGCC
ncbi:hypothetical protein NHX12_023931 [Muraenolepis orangiensis]|uniref:FHA domain-containing protein n=1 Tax=Muraenolepis orangiensis TaxID=630683 RepID=A0A9Q0EPR9_9TELE|nr:hypothetical protein NHX12_023931 [Muraenolepis orangiensis]